MCHYRHATRYTAACLDEEVHLHPHSSLHTASPEYVDYVQVSYMGALMGSQLHCQQSLQGLQYMTVHFRQLHDVCLPFASLHQWSAPTTPGMQDMRAAVLHMHGP